MNMQNNQKGITFIGFFLMLGILGFFLYGGMKLFPAYSEYYAVVKSVQSVQREPNIQTASLEEIRQKLNVQFDLQYVNEQDVPPSAITLNTSQGARSLRVAWDRDIPFMYNVDLLVHFEKTADLSRAAAF